MADSLHRGAATGPAPAVTKKKFREKPGTMLPMQARAAVPEVTISTRVAAHQPSPESEKTQGR